MRRGWLAVALLACGGLLSAGYFDPPRPVMALLAVLLAAVLLPVVRCDWPAPRSLSLGLALLLPAVWFWPWPSVLIAWLLILAALIELLDAGPAWLRQIARGLAVAAVILLAQRAVLEVYARWTARGHELPPGLTPLLGLVPRWLGLDATGDGAWIAVRDTTQVHRIAATWELLFDPASVMFLVGGVVLLAWTQTPTANSRDRLACGARAAAWLLAIVLAWAPLRAALLLSIWLQRALRADAVAEPNVADVFVNGWIHCGLLAGPVLLAAWWLPLHPAPGDDEDRVESAADRRAALAPVLVGIGCALLTAVVLWLPVGSRKSGNVTVVERHSTWEPTLQPYATTVYGEAGSYNYAAAYAYCGQYFPMARLLEQDAIDDATLANCGVLIIKTPTSRYSPAEVSAVQRFVAQGGSLLLIGDHTNVFNMNTCLNDVARRFGLSFRNDLLFHVGDPYRQHYVRPRLAHPIVQHVPEMDFAVSCSIDPGSSLGRMAIRSEGLFNLPPAYHESNYHPQAEYRPSMQYGSWCQMWASTYGRGRVVAFADSTLFSNFCLYQPGKAELLRGMVDWLDHGSVWDRAVLRRAVTTPLLIAGLLLLVAGLYRPRLAGGRWFVLLSASLAGGTIAAAGVLAWHRLALPVPALQRPLPHVVVDRQISQVPLFTGAFADDKSGAGYGLLEQWIPRVGNMISRSTDALPFTADGLVVICPNVSVSEPYVAGLLEYLRQGGQVLIFDSPDLPESTANRLLEPLGLRSNREGAEQHQGQLRWPQAPDLPPLDLQMSCEIQGGQPIATIGDSPVAAQVQFGKGRATVVGFGSLFSDAAMGYHWLPEPDELTRQRYDVLYHLLRISLPHQPVAGPG